MDNYVSELRALHTTMVQSFRRSRKFCADPKLLNRSINTMCTTKARRTRRVSGILRLSISYLRALRTTIPANLRGLRKLAEQSFYRKFTKATKAENIFFTLILFLRDLRALRGELFFSALCVSAPLRLRSGHALRELLRDWVAVLPRWVLSGEMSLASLVAAPQRWVLRGKVTHISLAATLPANARPSAAA